MKTLKRTFVSDVNLNYNNNFELLHEIKMCNYNFASLSFALKYFWIKRDSHWYFAKEV